MHLGAEVELDGTLDRATLEAAVAQAVARWPALACTAVRTAGGLAWRAASHALVIETSDRGALEAWRNTPIDPFREPPFGVLWIRGVRQVLAFRAHHAVADGQLFLAIAAEIVIALAGTTPRAPVVAAHPLGLRRLWREATCRELRHARTLAR